MSTPQARVDTTTIVIIGIAGVVWLLASKALEIRKLRCIERKIDRNSRQLNDQWADRTADALGLADVVPLRRSDPTG